MDLTEHFSLKEMTRSDYAVRKGLDNTPGEEEQNNLLLLCENVLEPLRKALGVSVHVSSGFRAVKVNKGIGGASKSQHIKGQAADIEAEGMTVQELYDFIKASALPYDRLISEFASSGGGWVHVSYSELNRKQNLIATKDENNKTIYTPDAA